DGIVLRLVDNYFRRRLAHLQLRAHFLDLGGLLAELGCESLYLFLLLCALFLLLRDRCFQLVNFVIHGLELGARKRLRRCATRHRCGAITTRCASCATTRVARVSTIDTKPAVCKSHSNFTNGDSVRDLDLRHDTTDKAIIVRDSSSSERTDRNHVGVASETKVTDPDIVSFAVCGDAAGANAQGGVEGAGK